MAHLTTSILRRGAGMLKNYGDKQPVNDQPEVNVDVPTWALLIMTLTAIVYYVSMFKVSSYQELPTISLLRSCRLLALRFNMVLVVLLEHLPSSRSQRQLLLKPKHSKMMSTRKPPTHSWNNRWSC